jgi:hypothetical protein
MSERPEEHPQEPAEGSEEDVEAPGAERAGRRREGVGDAGDGAKPSEHPAEPAEGADEDVEAPGAERAGDDN